MIVQITVMVVDVAHWYVQFLLYMAFGVRLQKVMNAFGKVGEYFNDSKGSI